MALRSRLLERFTALGVSQVGHLILRPDPGVLGKDQQGQWERVSSGRLVGEALRKLFRLTGETRPYYAVREFWNKQGGEFFHIHVVIDGMGFLEPWLLKAFQTWCQRHIGSMKWSYRPRERAVGYLTDYVTKGGRCPEWVRGLKAIRVTSCSKGYWACVSGDDEDDGFAESRGRVWSIATVGERLSACSSYVRVIAQYDGCPNEVVAVFEGGLGDARKLLESGKFGVWCPAGVYGLWLADGTYEQVCRRLGRLYEPAEFLGLVQELKSVESSRGGVGAPGGVGRGGGRVR